MFKQNWQSNKKLQAVKLLIMNNRTTVETLVSFISVVALLLYTLPYGSKEENKRQVVHNENIQRNSKQNSYITASYGQGWNWNKKELANVTLVLKKGFATENNKNVPIVDILLTNNTKLEVEAIKYGMDVYACKKEENIHLCKQIETYKDVLRRVFTGYPKSNTPIASQLKIREPIGDTYFDYRIFLQDVALREYIARDNTTYDKNVDKTCTCCGSVASDAEQEKKQTELASNKELNKQTYRGC